MTSERQRFVPSAEQRALFPEISGNAVNGLGEDAVRRPSPIYWHSPKTLAHGALQQYMLRQTQARVPVVGNLNDGLGGRGAKERSPKAATVVQDSPDSWSARVKAFALANEADLVGITALRQEWVFEGYQAALPWMIVLAMAMDHAELATAPEPASVIEVMRQYNRGTRAARALADWILGQGWQAEAHGGPQAGPVLLIPAALECGFGELGKHGSIINRRFGSSFRLAGVLTEIPLAADSAEAFGADDFCIHCRLCADACPPDAIAPAKQMVRGVEKWYVDFDRCIGYFNESNGCGICIAVCPWSLPGVAPKLAEKLTRRRERNAPAVRGR